MPRNSIKSFTLVELLIVIAILAVLAAAVVIVLNPAELLAQARDSQRITDLKTTKDAVDLFILDNPSSSLGTVQRVYISIPDTNTNCSGITGLPALPAGWSYVCVTSANLRNTNGTGWIPLDFGSIKGGSPMPYLPIDPTNDATGGKYYSYVMGSSYDLSALLESKKNFALKDGGPFVELYEVGSNLSLLPVSRDPSLVGYWTFEGSGSISNGQTTGMSDYSGKGNNGTASNANGTGMSFATGKVGNAVQLDGTDDRITVGNPSSLQVAGANNFSVSAWLYSTLSKCGREGIDKSNNTLCGSETNGGWVLGGKSGTLNFEVSDSANLQYKNLSFTSQLNTWYHAVGVRNGNNIYLYINGALIQTGSITGFVIDDNKNLSIGGNTSAAWLWPGSIDDVRIYNRALSDTEIKSLYEATK